MSITPKVSPDERITMNALESADPFARPGQVIPPVNQSRVAKKPGRKPKVEEKVKFEVKTPKVEENVKVEEEKPLENIEIPVLKEKDSSIPFKKSEEQVLTEKSIHISDKTPEIPIVEEVQTQELNKTLPYEQPIVESRSSDGLPSYRCEFAGRDIFVGFPCYKTTNPVTAFTMISMALDFGRDKIRFDMSIGEATVHNARNKLVQKFLETDAKWMLMIDDDIIPSIGRPEWMRSIVGAARKLNDLPLQRHIIHRLIGSGKTLVGGAYFGRQEGAPLMVSDKSLENKVKTYTDVITPVDWVGAGCLLIHRKVFNDIKEKFPELSTQSNGSIPSAFDYFSPINSQTGEDVSFCKRAKQAGHQPHVDLGTPVFHVGSKAY
jgi:hypothetical protein